METNKNTDNTKIEEIIGKENENNLRDDVWEALGEGANYNDIEDLMMGYGLEMDYIFDLF